MGNPRQLLGLSLGQSKVRGDDGQRRVERRRGIRGSTLGHPNPRSLMHPSFGQLPPPQHQFPVQRPSPRLHNGPRRIEHDQRPHRAPRRQPHPSGPDTPLQHPGNSPRTSPDTPLDNRRPHPTHGGGLNRGPPHPRIGPSPKIPTPPQIKHTRGRHNRHHMPHLGPHPNPPPPLLQPPHHPGRGVKPIRAPPGKHDRLNPPHHVPRIERIGFLSPRPTPTHINSPHSTPLRRKHNSRPGQPPTPDPSGMPNPNPSNVSQSVNCHKPSLPSPVPTPHTTTAPLPPAPPPAPTPTAATTSLHPPGTAGAPQSASPPPPPPHGRSPATSEPAPPDPDGGRAVIGGPAPASPPQKNGG